MTHVTREEFMDVDPPELPAMRSLGSDLIPASPPPTYSYSARSQRRMHRSIRNLRKFRNTMSTSSCDDDEPTEPTKSSSDLEFGGKWGESGPSCRSSDELLQSFSGACSLQIGLLGKGSSSYLVESDNGSLSSPHSSALFPAGGVDLSDDGESSMGSPISSSIRSRLRPRLSSPNHWNHCRDSPSPIPPRRSARRERSRSMSSDPLSEAPGEVGSVQVLPAISRLVQDAKSFNAAECHGEREMHIKFRLSRSYSDLCFPAAESSKSPPIVESIPSDTSLLSPPDALGKLGRSASTASNASSAPPTPDINDSVSSNGSSSGETTKINGCGSPSSSVSMVGSPLLSVDSPEPAMSPVGFFTTGGSPGGHLGRPRSGSQSPYRRTYTGPTTVQLRQSILGKRKPDEMDELKETLCKRLCAGPGCIRSASSPHNSDLGE